MLRIGHLSAIQGLSFDWHAWLQAYARATDQITPGVIEGVRDTYRHLRRIYHGAMALRSEWLQIRFGASLRTIPYEDMVAEEKLLSFLERHLGKHWRLRVD